MNGLFVIEGGEGTVFIEGGDEVVFISERGDPGAAGPIGGVDVEDRLADVEDATAGVVEGLDDLGDVVAATVAVLEQADTDQAAERDVADAALQAEIDAEEVLRAAQTAALAAANVAQDAARAASEAALAATVAAEAARALGAEANLIPKAWRGSLNGVAPLDGNGLIPEANHPAAIARDAEVDAKVLAEQIRADAYADAAAAQAKADLVDGAPALLNALSELAAAIGNDPDFAATIAAQIGGKQATHANLTALSGLVFAANEMVYSTGAGAFAPTAFTAQARALLDDADAPTMRTTLGVGSAGTHSEDDFDPAGSADAAEAAAIAASQPASALLSLLAGLAPGAGQFPYFTAANAVAMADVTAFAMTLLDDVSAVAMRGTLGAEAAGAAAAAQAASQPLAALLTNLVALAPGANTIPYINAGGAWAATTVSAFTRTLLDDANAAAARATLEIVLGVANATDIPTRADADARYLLVGASILPLYGDGSDGAWTLDGATTPGWATRVGNVYTLTRACFLTDLNVAAGMTLQPVGFPIYVKGTWSGTGLIETNGNAAAAHVGGAAIGGNHMLGGAAGGTGGTAVGAGTAGTARTTLAGSGGIGGVGVAAAGAAGVATPPNSAYSTIHTLQTLLNLSFYSPQIGPLSFAGGAGGGGGGGATATRGGGGGSGGGTIAIFAKHVTFTGTIEVKGGAGANAGASATNGGGGGGGGGGFIITVSDDALPAMTRTVTGGVPGNGVNGGTNGTVGAVGLAVHVVPAA